MTYFRTCSTCGSRSQARFCQRAKGLNASPTAQYGGGGGGSGSTAPTGVSSVDCGSGGGGCPSTGALGTSGVYACDGGVGAGAGGGVSVANAANIGG